MRAFILILLAAATATAATAAPLPGRRGSRFDWQSAPHQRYNIIHAHPDEEKLWEVLAEREDGFKKYFKCTSIHKRGEFYTGLFEYEKFKRCMRQALAETDGGLPAWVKDTPWMAPRGHTAQSSSEGLRKLPFSKEGHQLGNQLGRQLSHWTHALQTDMRRLPLFLKPVGGKAAPAQGSLLRAVQGGALE
ncbi:MAG: hypothetical protein M1826_003171 [Phylliscum demangeonii]|nr:MAG: hypothetical protein M1826_003171 [Phylliscum demangeonii]